MMPTRGGVPKSQVDEVEQLANSGQCDAAFAATRRSDVDPGGMAEFYAGIYMDCLHDRVTAIRYLTLSARYGSLHAPVTPIIVE